MIRQIFIKTSLIDPDEEKLLASNDYQNKLAAAIASAVKKFFMN